MFKKEIIGIIIGVVFIFLIIPALLFYNFVYRNLHDINAIKPGEKIAESRSPDGEY